jgi:hypothetical protein
VYEEEEEEACDLMGWIFLTFSMNIMKRACTEKPT